MPNQKFRGFVVTPPTTGYFFEDQANALHSYHLLDGINKNQFTPDLGSYLTRAQGVTLMLTLFGQKADAEKMTDTEVNLIVDKFKDIKRTDWFVKYVAYSIKNNISVGYSPDTWMPNEQMKGNQLNASNLNLRDRHWRNGSATAHQGTKGDASPATLPWKHLAKMILNGLGYTNPQEYPYEKSLILLQQVKGFHAYDIINYGDLGNNSLNRDNAVAVLYGTLTATMNNRNESVVRYLVGKKVLEESDFVTTVLLDKGK